jgi:hypothetical protein
MKVAISESENFYREVELTPVDALPGNFHLKISSTLSSAKDPSSAHKNFEAIISEKDVAALGELFSKAIA